MAVYRTSDHLTKCDPGLYSNIYDVRKRPDIKPISTPSIHKDTIEISKDKLKEEALSRLRHTTKVVIPQNGFLRVGKYLFLAVAFPPYLLLFGLPKWILVEAVPFVFSFISLLWNKVQQKGKQQIEKRTRTIVKMFQFIQRIAQVLILPIIRLTLDFRRKMISLLDKGAQLFKMGLTHGKRILSLPGKKLSEALKRLNKKITEIKEKISEQTQLMGTRIYEGIQWLAPLAVVSWGQLQFQKIKGHAQSKTNSIAQKMHSTQKNAKMAAEWVSKQFSRGKTQVKKLFQPLSKFLQTKALPFCKNLKEALSNKWKEARDFFQKKQESALSFLEKKQDRLKSLSLQYLLNHISSRAWLPAKLKALLLKLISYPPIKAICQLGISSYSFVARGCLSAISLLLKGIGKGVRFISNGLNQIKSHFLTITQKITHSIGIFSKIVRNTAFYALYYGILYTMMTGIIVVWGIRSLSHLMGSFKKLVRLKA